MTTISILVWSVALCAVAGVLLRPKGWPEAIWACAGAAVLVVLGVVPLKQAVAAVLKGTDV